MFKVKAVVVDFLGDKEKYPCHHQYKLGDEFVFDGANFIGGICPSLALEVVPMMINIHAAGPRYRGYLYYYPFLYAPQSVDAPELKKFDGLGYKNIFTNYTDPKYSMASLASSSAFNWPPPENRMPATSVSITCPDFRTSVRVKIEAFDLSDTGRSIPFFRRDMTILDKVLRKPGIEADKILGEFTKTQIEDIYPALSPIMVKVLLEELEAVGYVEVREGKVFPEPKAAPKLKEFKDSLSQEEISALGI
ncbi:MAG: hypothetical protein JXA46_10365 [Dehalococcoidales bacterium]|nr:hypothetical protein [Dehalococcoidales bacterium]